MPHRDFLILWNLSQGRNWFTRIGRFPIPEAEAKDDQKNTEDQRVGRDGPNDGEAASRGLKEEQNSQSNRNQATQSQYPFIGDLIS